MLPMLDGLDEIDEQFRKHGAAAYETLTIRQRALVRSRPLIGWVVRRYAAMVNISMENPPGRALGEEAQDELPKKRLRFLDDE